jgi:hypothetical protein
MSADQSQSSRLGQPVPVESTYVRMFDVDPNTPDADLIEASWPGQLIYRTDTSILMVFKDGGWEEVAGGVAGQVSYVGDTMPVGGSYTIGDTWYHAPEMTPYVWDGDSWEPTAGGGIKTFRQPEPPISTAIGDIWYDSNDLDKMYRAAAVGITIIGAGGWVLVRDGGIQIAQDTADIKTRAYYLPGFGADDGDPETPLPYDWPTGTTVGDIWYQTDDRNRMWFWTGVPSSVPVAGNPGWVDAHDPNVDLALAGVAYQSGLITNMDNSLESLTLTAFSAQNSADTADGRVSMSDYLPGPDDLTYISSQPQLDPITGIITYVDVQVPRVNGSIWFTRTRPRWNLCTNPSFETNDTYWTHDYCDVERHDHHVVPAGIWTYHVVNDATSTQDHWVAWGELDRVPCAEGQPYTVSVYAELDSGNGAGVTIQIRWYDAPTGGSLLATTVSEPMDLVLNAFDPALFGTINEPRLWVTGIAPAGAESFYVRVVSPAANVNDEWHTGAMLVEQEDDLGRYFDGDSYDGSWEGIAHNSVSHLDGHKIREIHELRDSEWIDKLLTSDTIDTLDVAKVVGEFSGTRIIDNTIAPDKATAVQVLAGEALTVGDLVNIYNDLGIFKARKATAGPTNREAHGFVWDTTAAGSYVYVYHDGYDPWLANLSPGNQWLSTTPGRTTARAPSASGQLVQQVGFAPSDTVLNFSPMPAIKIV